MCIIMLYAYYNFGGICMKKILTISVAAYNAEKWLGNCLDSFLIPEIWKDIEVLIINDGSIDGTVDIAQKYASEYPELFYLINKENGGHGSTINTAVQIANGIYFKVVDSDDWVEKQGMIELVKLLKKDKVDVVFSPFYIVDAGTGKKHLIECLEKNRKNEYENKIIDINQLNAKCRLVMHSVTFRTELLKNSKYLLDENCFYVDAEYVVYYFFQVKSVFFLDIPIYNYLLGANEQSVNFTNMIKRRKQHLQVCKKIIDFYQKNKEKRYNANLKIVKRTIEDCILSEYRILFSINDKKKSKKELLEFENYLKSVSKELYIDTIIDGKNTRKETAAIVWLLRKLRFYGYGIFHYILTLNVK